MIISAIGSIITLLVSLHIAGLSAGAGAAITSLLTALLIAATTRPIAPSLFVAVVAPVAALTAEYGLHLSDQVVTTVPAVILAAFTLAGIRPQVSPAP